VCCGSVLQSCDISLSSDPVPLAAEEIPVSTSLFTKLLQIKVITFCSVFAVKYGSMTTLIKNLFYIYELYVNEGNIDFSFFALEPELLLITPGILLGFQTLQE